MTAESHDEAIAEALIDIWDAEAVAGPSDLRAQLAAHGLVIVPTGGAYAAGMRAAAKIAQGQICFADWRCRCGEDERDVNTRVWDLRSEYGQGRETAHVDILASIPAAPAPEGEIEATSDQNVARLLHEEFPAWWNREARKGPGLAARTTIEEAFRAGILASIRSRPAAEPPAFYDNPDEEVQGRRAIEQSDPRNNPAAEPPGCPIPGACADVLAERARQIAVEGFTRERDDAYLSGQLAAAGACYAIHASTRAVASLGPEMLTAIWPWRSHWWKPKSPREDLVRAGALIIAEIERLDRAALSRLADAKGEGA